MKLMTVAGGDRSASIWYNCFEGYERLTDIPAYRHKCGEVIASTGDFGKSVKVINDSSYSHSAGILIADYKDK